jgi:hypothetical protein
MQNINIEELLAIVQEVSDGIIPTSTLLNQITKNAVKKTVNDAGSSASILALATNPSELNDAHKSVVYDALEILRSIHLIDKNAFQELCSYSGFTDGQIDLLKEHIVQLNSFPEASTKLLLESHSKNLLLIQNPKIQNLLKFREYDDTENALDDFVRYITKNGTPSVQLEKIARLSIYQKQQLAEDINNDVMLQEYFSTFLQKGTMSADDLTACSDLITEKCVEHMSSKTLSFSSKTDSNGVTVPIAIHSDRIQVDTTFFEKKSPPAWPDAWGFKNNHLDVFSVTMMDDFSTQVSQSFEQASAILNGAKTGYLELDSTKPQFTSFGWCNSVFGDNKNETFQNAVKNAVESKAITQEDEKALKASPVHAEALKILRFNSEERYSSISPHVRLGIHSSNSESFMELKPSELQFSTSFSNILQSMAALSVVADKNKKLNLMGVAFERAAMTLTNGFKNAVNSQFASEKKYKSMIDQGKELANKIQLSMINAGLTRNLDKMSYSFEDNSAAVRTSIGHQYKQQQKALYEISCDKINNDLHKQRVFHKSRSSDESITTIDMSSGSNLRDYYVKSIFNLTFRGGDISQALMGKALRSQIAHIKNSPTSNEGRFAVNKAAFKSLVGGMYNAHLAGYDIRKAVAWIQKNPNLVDCFKFNDRTAYHDETALLNREYNIDSTQTAKSVIDQP